MLNFYILDFRKYVNPYQKKKMDMNNLLDGQTQNW